MDSSSSLKVEHDHAKQKPVNDQPRLRKGPDERERPARHCRKENSDCRQQHEAEQWDPKAGKWVQILGGLSAETVNYSPDGEWISYVSFPEGDLWRSRPDGSEPLHLTFAPLP
jgi:hypothetical protein